MEKRKRGSDCEDTRKSVKKFKAGEGDNEAAIENIFASSSQADSNLFRRDTVGKQCLAMALSFLTRNVGTKNWNQQELNNVLKSGDELYRLIVLLCRQQHKPIADDGYLDINHVDVVAKNLKLHGERWRIEYNDNEVNFLNCLILSSNFKNSLFPSRQFFQISAMIAQQNGRSRCTMHCRNSSCITKLAS